MGASLAALLGQDLQVALLRAGEFHLRVIQQVLGVEADLDLLGQLDFFLRVQQRRLADTVEVDADKIGRRVVVRLIAPTTAVHIVFVCRLARVVRLSHEELPP